MSSWLARGHQDHPGHRRVPICIDSPNATPWKRAEGLQGQTAGQLYQWANRKRLERVLPLIKPLRAPLSAWPRTTGHSKSAERRVAVAYKIVECLR